jgi:hypothetical protein
MTWNIIARLYRKPSFSVARFFLICPQIRCRIMTLYDKNVSLSDRLSNINTV